MEAKVVQFRDGEEEGKGWERKDKGVERRPMRNAREKFRVDRVARNIPRRRREKHWSRRRWCGVRGCWRVIKVVRRVGRKRLVRAKRVRVLGRVCNGVAWLAFWKGP